MSDEYSHLTLLGRFYVIYKHNLNYPNRTPHPIAKMAKLIDGKQIAEDIRVELRKQIETWVSDGQRAPHLTCVLVGEDPASCTYVRNKMKVCSHR